MKALVYTATQKVTYRHEPEPVAADREVMVKVEASGICGSDMHAYHGHDERRVPPLILGHEAAGTVMDGQFAGQRMVLNPLVTCGHCADCLSGRSNLCASREMIGMRHAGAFAEYVSIDEANLIAIPDSLDMVHAALMEPAAVSLHSIVLAEKVLHRPLSECSALVIGGGAIGLQDNEPGLDSKMPTLQEITFIGNHTYTPTNLQAALRAISSGALGSLDWIETRALADGSQAFRDFHQNLTHAPKIVLLP